MKKLTALLFTLCFLVACGNDPTPETATSVAPIPTQLVVPTEEVVVEETSEPLVFPDDPNFITVLTSPPLEPFVAIDAFGEVVGVDAEVMRGIAVATDLQVEFVVTDFAGMLDAVASGEYDSAIYRLPIPEQPQAGLAYSNPYLRVGQVVVVRADETRFNSFQDISGDLRVGVEQNSHAERAAKDVLNIAEPLLFETPAQALQNLINGNADAVVLDSDDAEYFTTEYFQQLKVLGEEESAWLAEVAYGIVVSAENRVLLDRLNAGISTLQTNGDIARITDTHLVQKQAINAGDSLIGTASNELVIGLVGELTDLDPASFPDLIRWEINLNTMSGLYRVNAENGLEPALFTDVFISEDNLQYTFRLRDDLIFPDGTPMDAEDVRWSVVRSARLGNVWVNSILKDEDDNGFADVDAVQVLDPLAIRFDLKEPISYFPSLLATPAYAVLNDNCYQGVYDPKSICSGYGPYVIEEWIEGDRLQLRANPNWVGEVPNVGNVQIRFYASATELTDALNRKAIDVAWTGVEEGELDTSLLALQANSDFITWQGATGFSSSLVMVHDQEPWDNPRVREAVSLAVDRVALADTVFSGTRLPLYQPIPDSSPGHLAEQPPRDLVESRRVLTLLGYSENNPVEINIAYVNDGRYSAVEGAYAAAIKSQLEETGMISVTVEGAPWDVFRNAKSTCAYNSFLQGWPSPGQAVPYIDGMSWLYFFLLRTDSVCSNYESTVMDAQILALEGVRATDADALATEYANIQTLWAEEFPSIPLTQAPRYAVTLPAIQGVVIDAMGILHYDLLEKSNIDG